MEVKKMIITEPDKSKSEVEVITKFYDDGKEYVMYTKGERQGENTIVYISIMSDSGGDIYLDEIESDEEWTKVKGIIRDLLASK